MCRPSRVHVDTWPTTYRGLLPDEHLVRITYEGRERLWPEAIGTPREGAFVLVVTHARHLHGARGRQ